MNTPSVISGDQIATDVVRTVTESVLHACASGATTIDEVVRESLHREGKRLEAHGAARDRTYLRQLTIELRHASESRERELLVALVDRYVTEISGHFDRHVYQVATRAVPVLLQRLLDGLTSTSQLERRVHVGGEVEEFCALAQKGTVVLVPSHTSNLDSLVLGYVIDRLRLPPFAYGAGLNLFKNPVYGFFMRHLGAYTVDRQKTDPLYKQTLKAYSAVLLEHGQHSLFFPGGTRSRSGAVERHLKKGLLGTVPVAFGQALAHGRTRPRMFVVPCTITYPVVLEAASLVDEYLRREGKAQYLDTPDEFDDPFTFVRFLRRLHELDLQVHVRFGRALDPVGNDVDESGASLDPKGRLIDPADYFSEDGASAERDAEYTRLLAARIVDSYHRERVATPSAMFSFAAFAWLRRHNEQWDVFSLLRLLGHEALLPAAEIVTAVGQLQSELAARNVRLSAEADAEPAAVVEHALRALSAYHPTGAFSRRGPTVVVRDPKLLFYYRNRLDDLRLLDSPPLLPAERPERGSAT